MHRVMKNRILWVGLFVSLLFGLLLLLGPRGVQAQVACNISADKTTINRGESTMIRWTSPVLPIVVGTSGYGNGANVNGATNWSTGSLNSTTTYYLTGGLTSSCKDSVTVTVIQPPSSCTLTAPASVNSGQNFTISWGGIGVTSATLSGYPIAGSKLPSGSDTFNITQTTTYTFVGSNSAGSCGPISRTVQVNTVNTQRFRDNKPSGIPSRFYHVSGQPCASNGLLHARDVWLSSAAGSGQESITVPQGSSSVNVYINMIGKVCEGVNYTNVNPSDGRVENTTIDGDAYYIRDASISSSPLISGLSIRNLIGTSVSISRGGQYAAAPGQVWTGIDTQSFQVDGLSGVTSPGTYTITVIADVVSTSLANGIRVCNSNQQPTSGVSGSNCSSGSVNYTINLVIPPPVNPPPVNPSPTCTISANPAITSGSGASSNLTWSSTNATSASLDGAPVDVNNSNGKLVFPTVDTIYTLTVYGPGGSKECPITVRVSGSPPPVSLTCSMPSASPAVISKGDSSSLSWGSTAATSATLNDGSGPVAVDVVSSNYPVSPLVTTKYTLTVYGPGGSRTCETTVTISELPPTFNCDSRWYQTINGVVNRINLESSQYEVVGNTGNPALNAIGYNINDNFMYGMYRGSTYAHLVRISADGKLHDLSGDIVRAPELHAGDMDSSNNLWFIEYALTGNAITRVNVNDPSDISWYNLSSTVKAQDLVYLNGKLYGISFGDNKLYEITLSTNSSSLAVVERSISGLPSAGFQYTSGWSTADGKLYFFQIPTSSAGGNGKIYRIDNYQTSPVAVFTGIDTGFVPGGTQTDGASCMNAPDPLEKTNYPFLRVNGSDVVSGSKFGSLASRCETYPTTGLIGDIKTNGFKNHNYSATVLDDILSGSSSAQYAAYSKGRIFSAGSGQSLITNNGFYRSLSSSSTKYARDIMFSNDMNAGSNYGNYYDDSGLPCVDIAKVEQEAIFKSAPGQLNSIIADMTTPKEVVKMSGAGNWLVSSPITIPTGRQLTIITDGKVTINGNITYAKTGVANNGSVVAPVLMIIAKGGIEIGQDVTRIDGYYLAHGSTLNTCANISAPQTSVCDKQLVVGGALVGKKIEWRRNYGTLKGRNTTLANPGNVHCAVVDTAAGNVGAVPGALNSCAAERVDFSPAFYFANPFSAGNTSSSIHGQPLNTTELPPIY